MQKSTTEEVIMDKVRSNETDKIKIKVPEYCAISNRNDHCTFWDFDYLEDRMAQLHTSHVCKRYDKPLAGKNITIDNKDVSVILPCDECLNARKESKNKGE